MVGPIKKKGGYVGEILTETRYSPGKVVPGDVEGSMSPIFVEYDKKCGREALFNMYRGVRRTSV